MRPLRALLALLGAGFLSGSGAGAFAAPLPVCHYHDQPTQMLFQGIGYRSLGVSCKGLDETTDSTLAHVLRIDLTAPGIRVWTSRTAAGSSPEFALALPSEIVSSEQAQVAVNANLFATCCTYVAPAKTTLLRGLEMSDGKILSPIGSNPPKPQRFPFDASLLVSRGGAARITYLTPPHALTPSAQVAVTGSHMLVMAGRNVAPASGDDAEFFGPNARTLAGLSRNNRTLLLVAIDKSTSYSGLTLSEAGEVMRHVGAAAAINLDGGGSSTMVRSEAPGTFSFLNAPSDMASDQACTVYYPSQGNPVSCERYVGAILGIVALPLPRRAGPLKPGGR